MAAKSITFNNSIIYTEIREIFIVLAVASVLPVLVHLIPSDSVVPVGVRLLPIFYAPLVAIILFRPHVGIIAGLFAPLVNAVITGRPDVQTIYMLTADLFVFTAFLSLIYKRFKTFWGAALVAYLIAKFFSSVVLGIIPEFGAGQGRIEFFLYTIKISEPGLLILLLINFLAVKYIKKGK